MRILVTNDDGIESKGLHALVRAMCDLTGDHEIVVAAPDREFSGAGAALGALHDLKPTVTRTEIPDCDAEAWTVDGPPGLCVMFARLGAFGAPFDLIVSGINPGANIGRAVYHSGTVGAALTGRNGNVSGVAVSQGVSGFTMEGQAWTDVIENIDWSTSARVGQAVVQGLVDALPDEAVVINVNVPDLPLDEIKGWRHAPIGRRPPVTVASAELAPIEGRDGAFSVAMKWGERTGPTPTPEVGTDTELIVDGYVAISYLTRLEHDTDAEAVSMSAALDLLLD